MYQTLYTPADCWSSETLRRAHAEKKPMKAMEEGTAVEFRQDVREVGPRVPIQKSLKGTNRKSSTSLIYAYPGITSVLKTKARGQTLNKSKPSAKKQKSSLRLRHRPREWLRVRNSIKTSWWVSPLLKTLQTVKSKIPLRKTVKVLIKHVIHKWFADRKCHRVALSNFKESFNRVAVQKVYFSEYRLVAAYPIEDSRHLYRSKETNASIYNVHGSVSKFVLLKQTGVCYHRIKRRE